MKRIALVLTLAAVAGCATTDFFGPQTITLKAGQSFCTSSDPKVCAELFAMMAPLHTPEMNAAINAARIPGRTQ